jgi:hypothetical protein
MNVQIVWEQRKADKAALANSIEARKIRKLSAWRIVLHFFAKRGIGADSRRKVAGCISNPSI